MATNLKMQGELEPGLLMDMLQVIAKRKSLNGYVEVNSSATTGRIWLQEGAIIAADWNGRQGELAVECMLRLKQGLFAVGESSSLPVRSILKDTVSLLMQCLRSIGRDALTPVAPARIPPAPPAHSSIPLIPGSPPVNVDDPKPAPAYPPVARPRKRGSFMEGRWRKPVAIAAGLALAGGLSVMWGAHLLMEKKESALIKPTPEPLPPLVTEVAVTPVKPQVVSHDGWPDIIISALVSSGPKHGCAILNGQLLGVGEQVDGVTVQSIRANGVYLEYLGQHRFLCAAQKRMPVVSGQ